MQPLTDSVLNALNNLRQAHEKLTRALTQVNSWSIAYDEWTEGHVPRAIDKLEGYKHNEIVEVNRAREEQEKAVEELLNVL